MRLLPVSWLLQKSHHRLIGPAVLLAIVVLFHWKLTLTRQYTWLENPDMANLVLPWLQFQAAEWHHHRFPLWDPNSWFGQPLFGQGQPGSAYPLNWLLFLAPLKNGLLRDSILNWYYVLVRYLAALSAYALARELGRSRMASILAGCIYSLGGYVAATPAPQMVNGAVWTPLVFLFMFRAERQTEAGENPWASSLLSGFFLGFGWLAGHHQMNLYVSIAPAGLWGWFCVRRGKLDLRLLKLAAGSLAIAVLASAFQTIPLAEYGRLAVRFSGPPDPLRFHQTVPYSVLEQYSLKPLGLLGIVVPGLQKGANAYIGIVALSLALLGVMLGRRERQVRWLAALSLGGIIFSLGPNGLLNGVLYAIVPMLDKARMPGAGTVVFSLGIAPLAAYGLDLLPLPSNITTARRAGFVLASIGGLIAALAFSLYVYRIDFDDRLLATALAALLGAAALAARRRWAGVAAVGLILFELANVTDYFLPNRGDPGSTRILSALARDRDVADFLRSRGATDRVLYDDQLIAYNIGDYYGLEAVNAYTSGVLTKVWEMDVFSRRGMDFFGVRYYLGKTPFQSDFAPAFTGSGGVKVFENPTVYPRVWSVHAAASLPARADLLQTFHNPAFDPRQTALLNAPAPSGIGECGSDNDEVRMPVHQPSYVKIDARLDCRGIVILTDSSFPGWRATIDGKSTPILEAYGSVRGVVVEAGDHTIEMRYRPGSALAGALLTACAACVTMLQIGRARRQGLNKPS